MSKPVTIEDIYELFRASQAEADRKFAASKEEDERRKAEDERRKAEADRRAAEADRTMEELKQGIAKLEKTVDTTSKAVDSLTTRWGRFVEELVEPAVIRIFQAWGIDIKEIYPSARSEREPIPMEIHILAVDETELVLVECKCKLTQEDVDEFLEKLPQFKLAFSHYKNYQVYGAVAGIEINEGIDRYAYKKGLFVIKPSGDTVAIINDESFKPSSW